VFLLKRWERGAWRKNIGGRKVRPEEASWGFDDLPYAGSTPLPTWAEIQLFRKEESRRTGSKDRDLRIGTGGGRLTNRKIDKEGETVRKRTGSLAELSNEEKLQNKKKNKKKKKEPKKKKKKKTKKKQKNNKKNQKKKKKKNKKKKRKKKKEREKKHKKTKKKNH